MGQNSTVVDTKGARVKPADSVKLLDNIALAMRDLGEADTRLELADGSVVRGKELRVSSHVETLAGAQGVLDEPDMYTQLRAWILQLIENDLISPD